MRRQFPFHAIVPAMLSAFLLAIGQLSDRRILAVLGKTVAITLTLFAVLGWVGWVGLGLLLPSIESESYFRGIVAVLLAVVLGWVLFRLVALAVLQVFGDEIVGAVEARHYPALHPRRLGWDQELRLGLRGLGRALGYNLLALPVALLLLATAIGPALVFGAVNAVLLGRELTELVAQRHRVPGAPLVLPGRLTRFSLGAVIVVLLTVPFANLLAPIIGAAMATHLSLAKGRIAHAA